MDNQDRTLREVSFLRKPANFDLMVDMLAADLNAQGSFGDTLTEYLASLPKNTF